MCAALDRQTLETSPPALFLEIGAALGRDLPLLIITESRRKLPLPLAGIQSVELDFENGEAITPHVKRFAESLEVRRPNPLPPGTQNAPSPLLDARQFLEKTKSRQFSPDAAGAATFRAYQYEEVIRSVFSYSAAQVSESTTGGGPDKGFDFAAWVDTASEILGGPILVDCMIGEHIKPGTVSRAAKRLADVLYARSLYFGIIVYHNASDPAYRVPYHSPLPVGVISALELVERAESRTLSRALVKLRNSQMHQSQAGRE